MNLMGATPTVKNIIELSYLVRIELRKFLDGLHDVQVKGDDEGTLKITLPYEVKIDNEIESVISNVLEDEFSIQLYDCGVFYNSGTTVHKKTMFVTLPDHYNDYLNGRVSW